MIVPFVNWFWRKKPSPSMNLGWDLKLGERMQDFTRASREYDERMAYFESKLDTQQYQNYMELRSAANKLMLAASRLEFAEEILNKKSNQEE